MTTFRTTALIALMSLAGCQGGDWDKLGVRIIWDDAMDLPIGTVVAIWGRNVGLGVLGGATVSMAVFFVLKGRQWYRVTGRARAVVYVLIALFTIGVGGVAGGIIGNLQAGIDVAEVVLRDTAIGTKALPAAGELAAEVLAFADELLMRGKNAGPLPIDDAPDVKAGIHVVRVVEALNRVDKGAVRKVAETAIDRVLLQNPDWAGGTMERVVRWSMPFVADYLVDEHLRRKLAQLGIPNFLDELAADAQQRPNGVMTREEVGQLFAHRVLQPAVMRPVRGAMRQGQAIALALGLVGLSLPIGIIEMVRWLRRKPDESPGLGEPRPGA